MFNDDIEAFTKAAFSRKKEGVFLTLKSYKHKLERISRRNDRRKARAYLRQKRRDGKPQKPKMEVSENG